MIVHQIPISQLTQEKKEEMADEYLHQKENLTMRVRVEVLEAEKVIRKKICSDKFIAFFAPGVHKEPIVQHCVRGFKVPWAYVYKLVFAKFPNFLQNDTTYMCMEVYPHVTDLLDLGVLHFEEMAKKNPKKLRKTLARLIRKRALKGTRTLSALGTEVPRNV